MNRSRQPRVLKRPADQPEVWLLFSSGREKGFYVPLTSRFKTFSVPVVCVFVVHVSRIQRSILLLTGLVSRPFEHAGFLREESIWRMTKVIKVRECVHRFLAGFLSKFIGPVSMFLAIILLHIFIS